MNFPTAIQITFASVPGCCKPEPGTFSIRYTWLTRSHTARWANKVWHGITLKSVR